MMKTMNFNGLKKKSFGKSPNATFLLQDRRFGRMTGQANLSVMLTNLLQEFMNKKDRNQTFHTNKFSDQRTYRLSIRNLMSAMARCTRYIFMLI
jgi:hypothetical protein